MKKYRVSALILAMIMIIACFAACGTAGSNSGSESKGSASVAPTDKPDTSATEPTEEPTDEPEEPTSLYPLAEETHLTVLGPIYAPRAGGIVETWQDTTFYQAASKATNIWLDYDCVATEAYNAQFNVVLASGDMPDMFYQGLRQYAGSADQGIEEGLFANIADYLDYCPDYVAALEEYGYTNNVKTDTGNMVSFYTIAKNAPVGMMGFVTAQEYLDEIGMEAPKTYEDYFNVLKALKTEKGFKEPITMGYMGAVMGDYLCAGFDVSLYSHFILEYANKGFYQKDGTVHYGFLEDGFKEYVTMMNEWYNEGLFSPDFNTENENPTSPDYLAKISGGETGIALIDSSYIDTLESQTGLDFIPLQDAVKNVGDKTHLGASKDKEMDATYMISADSENIEAAVLWNNYWFTEEGSMLCNWGIEGETYEMVDGKPQFTDLLLNNPDGLSLSQTTYVYIGKLGVYDNARDFAMYSDQVSSLHETWDTNKDNAYKIPQGTTMTADESSDYNSKFSDINTLVQESLVKFIVGDKPLDEIDAFVEELHKMGIDDCIGYWQAALDRFNQR